MNQHLAKIRNIRTINYNTPILVPSFSSKGFPHVKELHSYLKEKLTEVSLISTYDLHYEYLELDQIYESDILIVDSGGYERNQEHDISDIYNSFYIAKEWNETLYEKQVRKLHPITDILLVNFDYQEAYPLKKQVQFAQKNFEKFPDFASDFLCKPVSNNKFFIDVDNLTKSIDLLSSFDVVGFTEKELGNSIFDRATSIYRIRKALMHAGLDTPIHIFGCVDPLSIVVYFLCGADIFDGLSWLRFSFKNGTPTYLNHYALSHGLWDRPDNEVKIIGYLENLELLSKLKSQLTLFTQSSNWEELHLKSREVQELKHILARIIKNYE
ncbi:hypothetical protein CN497_19290 [Priestia megaterium]|uniref:Uncharacterized protein n=1 Tax=Priestia megaterium TaxID=1404 RepID=A0AAE5P4S1_PRIMG|nr:hypothetical protein [Priestia megaterium]PES34757.1 hypothetical protein CN497_19290 [Priestia megaterium]